MSAGSLKFIIYIKIILLIKPTLTQYSQKNKIKNNCQKGHPQNNFHPRCPGLLITTIKKLNPHSPNTPKNKKIKIKPTLTQPQK
jgi:hypothetical protein